MKKESIVNIVVAFLNEIELDGETMQHIIEKVGMEQQMLSQLVMQADCETLKININYRGSECLIRQALSGKASKPNIDVDNIDVDNLAEKIFDDVIDNIDADDLVDYDLTMSGREVELRSISFDDRMMKRNIKEAIQEYIEDLKEVEA